MGLDYFENTSVVMYLTNPGAPNLADFGWWVAEWGQSSSCLRAWLSSTAATQPTRNGETTSVTSLYKNSIFMLFYADFSWNILWNYNGDFLLLWVFLNSTSKPLQAAFVSKQQVPDNCDPSCQDRPHLPNIQPGATYVLKLYFNGRVSLTHFYSCYRAVNWHTTNE